MPSATRHDWRAICLCGLIALTSACSSGGADPMVIEWDLSGSRSLEEVSWPEEHRDLHGTLFEPIESVRIRVTEDRVFSEDSGIHDVTVEREGDRVTDVQIDYKPETEEDAYRHALELADEWGIRRSILEEEWNAYKSGRQPFLDHFVAQAAGPDLAEGGPQPYVEVRYSFNDERPGLVSMNFTWRNGVGVTPFPSED